MLFEFLKNSQTNNQTKILLYLFRTYLINFTFYEFKNVYRLTKNTLVVQFYISQSLNKSYPAHHKT